MSKVPELLLIQSYGRCVCVCVLRFRAAQVLVSRARLQGSILSSSSLKGAGSLGSHVLPVIAVDLAERGSTIQVREAACTCFLTVFTSIPLTHQPAHPHRHAHTHLSGLISYSRGHHPIMQNMEKGVTA